MDKRHARLAEIVRIISHADEFGIPDIIVDMVFTIILNAIRML